MCKQLKRLILLADCPHLNKTDRDALQWAIQNISPEQSIVENVLIPLIDSVIPDGLNTLAWQTWIDYRKLTRSKKYKTNKTMKELAKMGSHDDQMKIVMISVNKEYQGLFALKGNGNVGQSTGNNARTGQKKSAYERAREANNEYRSADVECRGSNERQVVMGTDGGYMGRAVDEGTGRATLEHVDNSTFIDYE